MMFDQVECPRIIYSLELLIVFRTFYLALFQLDSSAYNKYSVLDVTTKYIYWAGFGIRIGNLLFLISSISFDLNIFINGYHNLQAENW